MYWWFCLVVCFATVSLSYQNSAVDQSILETVFGSPLDFVGEDAVSQATAVTPQTTELKPVFKLAPGEYDWFDLDLTKRVASSSVDNFLISPLGLKLALTVLAEASSGATKSELDFVLHNDLNQTVTRAKYADIINSLNVPSSEYIVNFGSQICMDSFIVPSQKFSSVAKEIYHTPLLKTNFSDPVTASRDINSWVNNLTHGKISQLLDEGDLANVVIMLLNVLYFKGSWQHQFDQKATYEAPFYVTPEIKKNVPFMNNIEKFHFVDSRKLEAKIVRLPYLGNKYSMYLVVPNAVTGVNRVIAELSSLRKEMSYMRETYVNIHIPRFELKFTAILDGILRNMGVWRAFTDTALFSGLSRGQHLYQKLKISQVLQKTGVDVNELGTTAYAATAVSLVNKFGMSDEIEEVAVNRPFFFFIEDEMSRQLLFTGKMVDPLITVSKL